MTIVVCLLMLVAPASAAISMRFGKRDGHLMVLAEGVLRNEGFPHALDNGAWRAFQNNHLFG